MNEIIFVAGYTTTQALCSTVLSILLAIPLSFFLYLHSFKFKSIILSILQLLFVLPSKLVALSIADYFNLNGFQAIVFAHVILNLPFACYLFYLRLLNFDQGLVYIAQEVGASNYNTLKDVYWPFLKSAIVSAFLIIFSFCFSSFTIPLLLGKSLSSITFHFYENDNFNNLIICSIMHTFFICFFFFFLQPKDLFEDKISVSGYKRIELINKFGIRIYLIFIGLVFSTIFFSIIKNFFQFNFYEFLYCNLGDCGMKISSLTLNSILVALFSSLITILLGLFLSIMNLRYKKYAKIISIFIAMPFVLGQVITGILFLKLSRFCSPSGLFLITMSHVFLNIYIAYKMILNQLSIYDKNLINIAKTFGASELQILTTLYFQFIKPKLFNIFSILFCLSLAEVGVSSMGANNNITLSIAIRILRKLNKTQEAMFMSLIILLLSFTCFMICNKLSQIYSDDSW